MKNHWLNKKRYKGFPLDDANSIWQGDPYGSSCNLDIWYNSRFIQNEDVVLRDGYGWLEYTPVLAGTLLGTIYIGEDINCDFSVSSMGFFDFTSKGSEFKVVASILKPTTGEIEIFWNKAPDKPVKLVVCYEYDLE